jgi:hypothetical protein
MRKTPLIQKVVVEERERDLVRPLTQEFTHPLNSCGSLFQLSTLLVTPPRKYFKLINLRLRREN